MLHRECGDNDERDADDERDQRRDERSPTNGDDECVSTMPEADERRAGDVGGGKERKVKRHRKVSRHLMIALVA